MGFRVMIFVIFLAVESGGLALSFNMQVIVIVTEYVLMAWVAMACTLTRARLVWMEVKLAMVAGGMVAALGDGGGGNSKAELATLAADASPLQLGDWLVVCGPALRD